MIVVAVYVVAALSASFAFSLLIAACIHEGAKERFRPRLVAPSNCKRVAAEAEK